MFPSAAPFAAHRRDDDRRGPTHLLERVDERRFRPGGLVWVVMRWHAAVPVRLSSATAPAFVRPRHYQCRVSRGRDLGLWTKAGSAALLV